MLDAFKGGVHAPKVVQDQVGENGHSGSRRSLLFEESAEMVGLEEASKVNVGNLGLGTQSVSEGEPSGEVENKVLTGLGDDDQNSALDDANLMMEGVLLSDSELVDEDWEEGEVSEFMEEMEEEPPLLALTEQNNIETVMDDTGTEEADAKATKKKGAKAGAFGGTTKTHLVHKFLSPRKNKISKATMKNGDKGNGEGKKAGGKPSGNQ